MQRDGTPSRDARPVLTRKIQPPALADSVVERGRVRDRLVELIDSSQLVIVSAAAGSGKTTAVRQALLDREDVAWLTLDRTDVAPGRLIAYLEASVGTVLPNVRSLATDAVASGMPPAEAAGLVASAAEGRRLVLVLDEVERLGDSPEAWTIVENVLRYASPSTTLVMISRRPVPGRLCAVPPMTRVGVVEAADLAFDVDEAALALARAGVVGADPASLVAETGGWITGVLFGSAPPASPALGALSSADALNEYIGNQILAGLSAELRDFLITTSVLPEVTVDRARALGIADVSARFAELRTVHIPAVLDRAPLTLRCHSRFREFLLEVLNERPESETAVLYAQLGRMHVCAGHHEDAVPELLRAGAVDEALASAAVAILGVIEGGDLEVAQSWLDALGTAAHSQPELVTGDLMIAIARDDLGRARTILQRVSAAGTRDALAASSDQAAAMMAWTCLHEGDVDTLAAILASAPSTPVVEAVRYASWMITDHGGRRPPPGPPPLTRTPVDALAIIAAYTLVRGWVLDARDASEWVGIFSAAAQVVALRCSGRTGEALEALEAGLEGEVGTVALRAYIGPDLLVDAQQEERARLALADGREAARRSGSVGYQALNLIAAARLEVLIAGDPYRAITILDELASLTAGREFAHIAELADTWRGLALLLLDEAPAAAKHLRGAVGDMQVAGRLLELPAAAIFLSEAEWRLGHHRAADRAADLALTTSLDSGTRHFLVQALRAMPGVLTRRLDSLTEPDSEWHAIGRALRAGLTVASANRGVGTRGSARLLDFGPPVLLVDGAPARPRISKSLELFAYLASRPEPRASREGLLEVLFDGRDDPSARTYLRQAIHHLRRVLPSLSDIVVEAGQVGFGSGVAITSASREFGVLVDSSVGWDPPDRRRALREALDLAAAGDYLVGATSTWIERRRAELAERITQVRFELAELALHDDDLTTARTLCATLLEAAWYHEPAWRLAMRVAHAMGDDAAVLDVYYRCAAALGELDLEPAVSTRRLLQQLRR